MGLLGSLWQIWLERNGPKIARFYIDIQKLIPLLTGEEEGVVDTAVVIQVKLLATCPCQCNIRTWQWATPLFVFCTSQTIQHMEYNEIHHMRYISPSNTVLFSAWVALSAFCGTKTDKKWGTVGRNNSIWGIEPVALKIYVFLSDLKV